MPIEEEERKVTEVVTPRKVTFRKYVNYSPDSSGGMSVTISEDKVTFSYDREYGEDTITLRELKDLIDVYERKK